MSVYSFRLTVATLKFLIIWKYYRSLKAAFVNCAHWEKLWCYVSWTTLSWTPDPSQCLTKISKYDIIPIELTHHLCENHPTSCDGCVLSLTYCFHCNAFKNQKYKIMNFEFFAKVMHNFHMIYFHKYSQILIFCWKPSIHVHLLKHVGKTSHRYHFASQLRC